MKTPTKDTDKKKLQQNLLRRERYANLTAEKKTAMLEKNKKTYQDQKNSSTPTTSTLTETKRLERNAGKRKWYAELSTDRKADILKKARQAYAERKVKDKLNQTTLQLGTQTQTLLADHNTECNNTFENGSSSSCPVEMAESATCSQLTPTGSIFGKCTTKPRTQRRQDSKSKDDILKNIASTADSLPVVPSCKYCAAKKIYRETNGFCCSNGEVALVSNDLPDDLYNLYTSQTDDALHFRTYIRTYNNTFAFTSFGVKYDKNLCQRNKGIYTFKVQGQVYHYINEIIATTDPSYLQLYIYDTQFELTNRMKSSPTLRANVAATLIHVLDANPYATFFRRLSNTTELTTYQIKIKANPDLDQRIYNCPTSSQVAAIWLENTESLERKGLDILVYNHAGYSHSVKCYYGCYDPLQYPLLFPYGQSGWHQGIERRNKRSEALCGGQFLLNPIKTTSANEIIEQEEKIFMAAKKKRNMVSCREYYCYKLQIRPDDKSALLQAGRLLQQYIVDMYVKLETCRLDYFRNNQK